MAVAEEALEGARQRLTPEARSPGCPTLTCVGDVTARLLFIDLTDRAASPAPNGGVELDGPLAMTDRRAPLLDVDPELGQLLDDSRRERARRELIVQLHQLAVGPWDAERL